MEYGNDKAPDCHTVRDTAEFDEIRWRFYAATDCTTIFELAAFLGTTPVLMSEARRSLRIPMEWFRIVFLKTGTDPIWLRDGMGES